MLGACGGSEDPSDEPGAAGSYDFRPDIVLITIDTLRADHLSCYGYPRNTTPTLDALAADGVLCG